MNPFTKTLLIVLVVASIGVGIWYYVSKKTTKTGLTGDVDPAAGNGTSPTLASKLVSFFTPDSNEKKANQSTNPVSNTVETTTVVENDPTTGQTKTTVTTKNAETGEVTTKTTTTPTDPTKTTTTDPKVTDPTTTTTDPKVTDPTTTTTDPVDPGIYHLPKMTGYSIGTTKTREFYYETYYDGRGGNPPLTGNLFFMNGGVPTPIFEAQLRIVSDQYGRRYTSADGIPLALSLEGEPMTYNDNGTLTLYKGGGFAPPAFRYNLPASLDMLNAMSIDQLLDRINRTSFSQGSLWALETTDTDAYNALNKRLKLPNSPGFLDSNASIFFVTPNSQEQV